MTYTYKKVKDFDGNEAKTILRKEAARRMAGA